MVYPRDLMCVLLCTFYGSVLTLIGLPFVPKNTVHVYVFQILSIHLVIPKYVTDKYVSFVRFWSKQITKL